MGESEEFMRVYRYFNQAEYDAYMAGDLKRVARQCVQTTRIGSDVCLKFFKNVRDIEVMRRVNGKDMTPYYLGVYDIPMSMIRKVKPDEKYPAQGYDVDYQTVKEFAVPVFRVKPEFFTAVISDPDKSKTVEEIKQEIYELTSDSPSQNQPS